MQHKYASPIVLKYGGNAMSPGDPLLAEAVRLHRSGTPVVLVHGGGPEIDRWLAQRGVTTTRIDGLRVTDAQTLEVTEAVLCATINKRLVRACTARGARAVGVSGEDGATLTAVRAYGSHGEDLGYVGDVSACDPSLIALLLENGYLPVVAPLATAPDGSHAFNVNADLAAAAIAGALRARAFILATNVARVLRDPADPTSGIDTMTLAQAHEFLRSPACSGGMQPKLRAAIAAVESGAQRAYICEAGDSTIERALDETAATVISA
ncbi:MAG TPA: acetylglutamate kinase [Candidatus Aquilonibacter sp.]